MLNLSRLNALKAPVLDRPVVILESDDWGPGPEVQVQALDEIRLLLSRFRDDRGRHPVMTMGVILSVPDVQAIEESGRYQARYLNEPEFRSLVDILKQGTGEAVFDLQLHGMAHYWPSNLMTFLDRGEDVPDRWSKREGWRTESLPSWLQSRWIDAGTLPSKALPYERVREAVADEIELFRCCFGMDPKVAVPPTFVWDDNVERAYGSMGVEVLITPGRRYPGRKGDGALMDSDKQYVNGQLVRGKMKALVRDLYFEPALGHRGDKVLEKISWKWSRREPALIETHRFNYLGEHARASLDALERLLEGVMEKFPAVRFMSSRELAREMDGQGTIWKGGLEVAWKRLRS